MKTASAASERLPDAGAKDTKRKRAVFARFNAEVWALLEARGARLTCEYPLTPDSLIGYVWRTYEIDTRFGTMKVSAHGNWVACRFDDPDHASAPAMNRHSGKWNHHYFGHDFAAAVQDVARVLDSVHVVDARGQTP